MITAIGSTALRPALDALRNGVGRSVAARPATETDEAAQPAVPSPVAALVAGGAPIDTDRVSAIRAQIAAGTYRVDPQTIAQRMIAADLPAA